MARMTGHWNEADAIPVICRTEGQIMSHQSPFARFAHAVSHLSGRPASFAVACLLIIGWAVSGPFFGFSETWQLVINTATTIITFLMVFVLQNTQDRDGEAVQAKLDELIYAVREADNSFVQAEKLSDKDLHAMRERLLKQCAHAEDELTRRGHRFEKPADRKTSEPA
jgi:low affinity Fe/Cu permease